MRKPNNLIREIHPSEFKDLSLPRRNNPLRVYPHALPHIYLVKQRCGRAYTEKGFVTIPEWAETKGKDYFLYYIAHELSHILGMENYHDFGFYKMFIKICPKNLQYYELHYKPSAAKFGIKK